MKPPISSPERGPGPWPPDTHGEIDRAIESLEREGLATQERARKLVELEHAKEVMKQNIVKSAAVVTGQIQTTTENGDVVFGGNNEAIARNKSVAIQSIAGGLGATLNLVWITWAGTEAPSELYAAIPVVVQLGAQAIATAVNNTKKS